MKTKKGFTLIEIIMCIAIIAVVSVSSIVGFNIISKNIRVSKLKDIEDEIMTAAQIYLETNNIAQQQLEEEGNSVILPLNVLVNEGLLDLSTTELDMDDISNEYVVAALGNYDGSTNCVGIKDGSWNLSSDSPLYICTNTTSTGTSSNLAIIDPSSMSNANKASQEPFVFKGANPNNYVKYNSNLYRIYYIDTDDSIVLVSRTSFGSTFDGKTMPICGITKDKAVSLYGKASLKIDGVYVLSDSQQIISCIEDNYNFNEYCNISSDTSEKIVDFSDFLNTSKCAGYSEPSNFLNDYFLEYSTSDVTYSIYRAVNNRTSTTSFELYGYKIHLKSCVKIQSGTGNYTNPYILDISNC